MGKNRNSVRNKWSTGYVTSNNNENYVFAILIQNFPGDSNEAKALEDELVKAIVEL